MPTKNTRRSGGPQDGFTLIEILVALAVLAMVFAAGLEVFSRGLRALAVGDDRTVAVQYARSKFDEVLGEGLREGVEQGRANSQGLELLWRVTVTPYAEDALGPTATRQMQLMQVGVEILWQHNGRRHAFSLVSLRPLTEQRR